MSDHDPALIEKAARLICHAHEVCDACRDDARAVLDAVADDLRAEGYGSGFGDGQAQTSLLLGLRSGVDTQAEVDRWRQAFENKKADAREYRAALSRVLSDVEARAKRWLDRVAACAALDNGTPCSACTSRREVADEFLALLAKHREGQ